MKIRFAQLYAAHAAFDRYAALIIAKTRVQSGGGSLPYHQDTAIILTREKSLKGGKPKPSKPSSASDSLAHGDSSSQCFFKEINFFVEHQNNFCTEFVEYVFSAWARGLQIDASSLARTSDREDDAWLAQ